MSTSLVASSSARMVANKSAWFSVRKSEFNVDSLATFSRTAHRTSAYSCTVIVLVFTCIFEYKNNYDAVTLHHRDLFSYRRPAHSAHGIYDPLHPEGKASA